MKIITKILALILGVIGFTTTSCLKMYGQPTANFKLNATVTDSESGVAIEGIRLVVKPEFRSYYTDTLYTDAKGTVSRTWEIFPEDQAVTVVVQDADASKNGLYAEDSIKIDIKNADFRGGDGEWYYGEQTKDVAIKLKKQQ